MLPLVQQLEFGFTDGQKREADEASGEGFTSGADVCETFSSIEPQVLKSGFDRGLTAQCAESLLCLGLDGVAAVVEVQWNSRMRTTAGRAFWPDARIELNPKLEQLAPDEVQRTLLHELAHLVAYARAGRKRISAHGVEWQLACAQLGIPGERATHSLPLPGRTMARKWRYECPACGEGFDRVRRLKRWAGCYACCKQHNGGYYHRKFRLLESQLDVD
ncbi:SprT-like domain-containing protein [Verrucomicrobiaceae bacterium N1E253]|uniref:SprT-like domain-containing protein n=1 Tax=Oceaniferula marina TaxID=2748318 RepID=A0A851GMW6_9BACT|nr:SprT-like domain-containing protein [Oceaniferula marina]NWK56367.1 SprT-like domain-containing protein [Oceaniferula marina]